MLTKVKRTAGPRDLTDIPHLLNSKRTGGCVVGLEGEVREGGRRGPTTPPNFALLARIKGWQGGQNNTNQPVRSRTSRSSPAGEQCRDHIYHSPDAFSTLPLVIHQVANKAVCGLKQDDPPSTTHLRKNRIACRQSQCHRQILLRKPIDVIIVRFPLGPLHMATVRGRVGESNLPSSHS